jgi:hypothetical protein
MCAHRLPALGLVFLLILGTSVAPAVASHGRLCEPAGLAGTPEDFGEPPDFTQFGAAVAISGNTAAVGIPQRTFEGPRGRVAVYTCDTRTRTWTRTASIDPQGQGEFEGLFGSALILQGDRLIVGSTNAVHVYEKRAFRKGKSGGWHLVARIAANGVDRFIAPVIAYDHPYLAVSVAKVTDEVPTHFVDIYRIARGDRARHVDRLQPPEDFSALALDNRTLVAGAQVYAKHKDGKWRLRQILRGMPSHDSFATADIALERDTILIGSPLEDATNGSEGPAGGGAVYVFQLERGKWEQTQRIRPDVEQFPLNGFGATLAFDGGFAVIGTPFPYGGFQRDFGPTFVYRFRAGRLVFDRLLANENLVATALDVADRQVIVGTNFTVLGLPTANAQIQPLTQGASTQGKANDE